MKRIHKMFHQQIFNKIKKNKINQISTIKVKLYIFQNLNSIIPKIS